MENIFRVYCDIGLVIFGPDLVPGLFLQTIVPKWCDIAKDDLSIYVLYITESEEENTDYGKTFIKYANSHFVKRLPSTELLQSRVTHPSFLAFNI